MPPLHCQCVLLHSSVSRFPALGSLFGPPALRLPEVGPWPPSGPLSTQVGLVATLISATLSSRGPLGVPGEGEQGLMELCAQSHGEDVPLSGGAQSYREGGVQSSDESPNPMEGGGVCPNPMERISVPRRGKGMEVSLQEILLWARPDELDISMDWELPEDAQEISDL